MLIKTWNKKEYQIYLNYLKEISEAEYKKFSTKLTETKYEILGIRVPKLRQIAKDISSNYREFLKYCGDKYFEEVFIEGLVISKIKDEEEFLKYFYQIFLLMFHNISLNFRKISQSAPNVG